MSRYLIRGGRSPLETISEQQYANDDLWGNNVGNYVYLNGVLRTLIRSEEDTFDCTKYRIHYSDKEIDQINHEYDAFLIPLADAFRTSFVTEMQGLTETINRLTIPCCIIGVGCTAGSDRKLAEKHFGFEEEAKAFIRAVLNHSACIGLRGGFTGEFMEYLGFREGEDFRVIGCPSLYTYGGRIQIRDTQIGPDSRVACNGTIRTNKATLRKMQELMGEFQNLVFVPQRYHEFLTYYLGCDYRDRGKDYFYPTNTDDPFYAKDRVRFFYNTDRWIDYYRTMDLVFGTRCHGNIVAVLAGTPDIMFPKDIRMREIAEFHHLTHVNQEDLQNVRDIWELIDSLDFHSPEAVAEENFENYLDFLHVNGLPTIYDEDKNRQDAPLDAMIAKATITPEPSSFVSCSEEERTQRLRGCYESLSVRKEDLRANVRRQREARARANRKNAELQEKNRELQEKNRELERQRKALEEQCRRQEATLNLRSVRAALKVRKWLGRN